MTEILLTFKEMYESGISPILLNLLAIIVLFYLWDVKIHPILSRINYTKIMKIQSKTDSDVIKTLRKYIELVLCDRIAIYEFHNTAHNLHGKSFLKFTCTYEVCRLGIQPYNISNKDIPIASIEEIVNMVEDNRYIKMEDTNSLDFSPEFRKFATDGEAKSLLLVPIIYRGCIYGFISISFVRAANFSSEDVGSMIKNTYVLVGEVASKICLGK